MTGELSPYPHPHPNLLSGLKELREQGELVDITLRAEGRSLPCHKLVLAATSAYFRAMFTNDLSEKSQKEVDLPLIDFTSLKDILDYMYTGKIDVTRRNAQSLFTAACMFVMPELQKLCAEFMGEELHLSNCLTMYQFASFHHCPKLLELSREFCVRCFRELMGDEDMMQLGVSELKGLLKNDDLNVQSEEDVVKLTLKWIEHDIDGRLCDVLEVMSCIRFSFLSEKFVTETLLTNELLMSDNNFCALLTSHELDKAKKEVPRLGMYSKKMLVFASGGESSSTRSMACYDPKSRNNYWAQPMHSSFDFKYKVDYHRITVTDRNEIFLSGGVMYEDYINYDRQPALRDLRMYDHHKLSWVVIEAAISTPRCAHGFVSVNRFLYLIGGKSLFPKGDPIDSVERYDIEEQAWQAMAPLPFGLYHHSAETHGGKVYVLGGIARNNQAVQSQGTNIHVNALIELNEANNDVAVDCFMIYDVDANAWTILSAHMFMPRCQFGSAVLGDHLYVIGGSNGQYKVKSVEVYDFQKQKWRYEEDFPEDRKSMTAVSMDGQIWICGGQRTIISRHDQSPRIVEARDLWKFDPVARAWSQVVPLVQFANIHSCAVADMNTKMLHLSEYTSGANRRQRMTPQRQ